MGLFGSLISLGFGGPPKLAPWQSVDAQQEQAKAIAGNQAALPGAESLASGVNTFNQGEVQRLLELAMPGYAKLRDRGTSYVNDLLAGRIPSDVSNQIRTSNATRSLYGGFGGTQAAGNLTARDLGLTSLGLMGQGLDSASRWIAQARTLAPTMDVTSMFLSPQFQTQFATNERNARLGYQNTKNQFDYASDPMRGVESSVAGLGDLMGTALMGYLGGGIGGMAGGAAGGAGGSGFMSGLGGLFGMGSGGGTSSALQMLNGFGGLFGGGGSAPGSTFNRANPGYGNSWF